MNLPDEVYDEIARVLVEAAERIGQEDQAEDQADAS
jgi:hypothetical protein